MEYIWKLLTFLVFAVLAIFYIGEIKFKIIKANRHLKCLRKKVKKYNIQSQTEAIKIIKNVGSILNKM